MKLKGAIGGVILAVWLVTAGIVIAKEKEDFSLVVNIANRVNILSQMEAERMFLGKKRSWADGTAIAVIINENPKIYDSFSHTILRRSPRQFLIFRKKMLFRGQGMPSPTAKTDKEIIEFVSTHVGGFGYVSPESVTLAVKVVHISQ